MPIFFWQGDVVVALEKAKEAGKKERLLCRHREQAGLVSFVKAFTLMSLVRMCARAHNFSFFL